MTRNRSFYLDIGWQTLLKDFGLQPGLILRRAALPEDLFSREDRGLSADEYFRFWRALDTEAADPMFAIRIVEAVSAEAFSPPLFAALCSANLMQAVQRLAKYKQLVAPMSLDVGVSRAGELTVSPRWLMEQTDIPASLQVAEVAFFLRLARLATREPINAQHVVLQELPTSVVLAKWLNYLTQRLSYRHPLCGANDEPRYANQSDRRSTKRTGAPSEIADAGRPQREACADCVACGRWHW